MFIMNPLLKFEQKMTNDASTTNMLILVQYIYLLIINHDHHHIKATFLQKQMLQKYQKSMVVDKLTTPHREESMNKHEYSL